MSRVVQVFIDPEDMEIDDANSFVIWIELPDGLEMTADPLVWTVTDTDLPIDSPGIDLRIKETT